MKLDEIAIANGTDKSSLCHDYCNDYDDAIKAYLKTFDVESVSLLEIGVWTGASLKMWKDYFSGIGVKHKIVGIDLNPNARQYADDLRDVFVEIGDQSDEGFLSNVAERHGPFDIILDDGSHFSDHQKKSFLCLFSARET